MKRGSAGWLGVLGLLATGGVRAEVRLPALFSDNMVLQRDRDDPIWGWADPGEPVTVQLDGHSAKTVAGDDGRWMVRLPRHAAGGPYDLTVAGRKGEIKRSNVAVGEVWLASGQSNMEFSVGGVRNAAAEIAAANDPMIRMFTVAKHVAAAPVTDVTGQWEAATPSASPHFSAVGYFFAKRLRQTLGVPIGIIHTSWGGTPAEAWTRRQTLSADPDLHGIVRRWDDQIEAYRRDHAAYETALARWKDEAERAKTEGREAPKQPEAPKDPAQNSWLASGLFNGMVAPLAPFGIRGAIWYQGESNADRAYQYRRLFPTMIDDWRRAWGQGPFPFLFVQLANFMPAKPDPEESAWAELREAQSMTLRLPNTGQAVIIDVGEAGDIHPKNKQDVGLRLALAAEHVAYRRHGEYSGPVFKSAAARGDRMVVTFTHARGMGARGGGPVKGFAVAGEDRHFVWADATIHGDTVEVRAAGVPHPVAVRYAWANNPDANLVNGAGLPASPFRSDDWPGVTVKNR